MREALIPRAAAALGMATGATRGSKVMEPQPSLITPVALEAICRCFVRTQRHQRRLLAKRSHAESTGELEGPPSMGTQLRNLAWSIARHALLSRPKPVSGHSSISISASPSSSMEGYSSSAAGDVPPAGRAAPLPSRDPITTSELRDALGIPPIAPYYVYDATSETTSSTWRSRSPFARARSGGASHYGAGSPTRVEWPESCRRVAGWSALCQGTIKPMSLARTRPMSMQGSGSNMFPIGRSVGLAADGDGTGTIVVVDAWLSRLSAGDASHSDARSPRGSTSASTGYSGTCHP